MTGTANLGAAGRIETCFQDLAGQRAALIPYITAGYPDPDAALAIAGVVAEQADLLEIGIPFSDPVADGPVIQVSSQAALAHGITVDRCLELVRSLRSAHATPVIFLTYFNPVLCYGLEPFAQACREVGVDGVIGADLPVEEAGEFRAVLASHDVRLIPLVAPTSTDDRLQAACASGAGFVYCVSRTGVTGAQTSLQEGLEPFLARVRACTDLPRAVGFGISTAHQAAIVSGMAEGVIIGSALVALIQGTSGRDVERAVHEFLASIKSALVAPSTEPA